MKPRTGIYKNYIYLALVVGLLVIAFFFSRVMIFSGEPLSSYEMVVTVAFLTALFVASTVLLVEVHYNWYYYRIDDDGIVIKKLIRTYHFKYHDILRVSTKKKRLYVSRHYYSKTSVLYRLTIQSDSYHTTIQFASDKPEKEMLKQLRKNISAKIMEKR